MKAAIHKSMIAYLSEQKARARFGTSSPKELIGKQIKSSHGEPFKVIKAKLLGSVAEDGTFEIKLILA